MSGVRQHPPLYVRFQAAAGRTPHKIALVVGADRLSYAELLREVDALADGLAGAGVRAGQHLGVYLPNSLEMVVVLLAAARLGVVIVPQSLGLSAEALASTLHAARVQHLIAWGDAVSALAGVCLPPGGLRVAVGRTPDLWLSWQAILAAGKASPRPVPDFAPEAHLPYLLVLTSGSTGDPKPIVLSQQTKILRAEAAAALYGVTANDVTLAATPLHHSLAQRLVLLPLITGGTSVVMVHFSPEQWLAVARREGVSFSIAVSSQLRQLLGMLLTGDAALPALRCLVSSSALLDDATKARLRAQLRCEFHECYGTSEVAIVTNLSPRHADAKQGSVGTPLPGVDVLIRDEQGRALPANTPGEISCRTAMAFSGYYDQPAATAAAFRDDFFCTGDLGMLDEAGFLYFLGRIKDIIICGGVNIYPRDIEDVIGTHPDVAECAAIALADDRLGEVVGVVVAARDPAVPPETRALQRLCIARLGDYQQPRHFFFVDALPRNALGKLDKRALRAAYSTPDRDRVQPAQETA